MSTGQDGPGSPEGAGASGLPLIAYRLPGREAGAAPAIVPAPAGRHWMRETHKQFAHRCLPLLMANQSGWLLLNTRPFRVTWDGGTSVNALRIEYLEGAREEHLVSSIFGYGILTWSVGYLFRTPPGYNLSVRGPANMPKDGISPLDGLVETDWAVASFTMNWKLTRPGHAVIFDADEPFCMIAPQRRHELEEFLPRVAPIREEPELAAQWLEFHKRRLLMSGARRIAQRSGGHAAADQVPFERHYFEGTSPGGWSAPEHQKKRSLHRFQEAPGPREPGGGAGAAADGDAVPRASSGP